MLTTDTARDNAPPNSQNHLRRPNRRDRGGPDAAIDCGIPDGGWCPKGRKAEDGHIPDRYELVEMKTADYLARTRQNVIDSHVTLVFTYGKATGGSALTLAYAGEHCKPHVHIDLSLSGDDQHVAQCVLNWMRHGGLSTPDVDPAPRSVVVNVAGSRESKAPGIQERVRRVMRLVIDAADDVPEGR